jgi:hypothetical protein
MLHGQRNIKLSLVLLLLGTIAKEGSFGKGKHSGAQYSSNTMNCTYSMSGSDFGFDKTRPLAKFSKIRS